MMPSRSGCMICSNSTCRGAMKVKQLYTTPQGSMIPAGFGNNPLVTGISRSGLPQG